LKKFKKKVFIRRKNKFILDKYGSKKKACKKKAGTKEEASEKEEEGCEKEEKTINW